jgi:hypothetical protein
MAKQKGFFAGHAKSSAAVVTLMVHAIIIVIAFFFVAVTVIQKQEVDFEAKPVNRPRMNLRKLQVPVNVKKPPQQPKLRKQIVVKPNIAKVTPDIKMPEIVGVKGGLGAGGGGGGSSLSMGFTLPEIDFFGIKGKSERIMLILDGHNYMSKDALGGAYGFEVIKNECLKLIEGLPSTAVFNMVVYGKTHMLFPQMVAATDDNVEKAKAWLMPLNEVKGAKTTYGVDTLGKGGIIPSGDYPFGKFKEEHYDVREWQEPVMLAMKQQADTVFLLTSRWGYYKYETATSEERRAAVDKWLQTSAGKKWTEAVAESRKMLNEDNAERKKRGEPPNSVSGTLDTVRYYCPGTPEPPHVEQVSLGLEDFVDAFQEAYRSYSSEVPKLEIKKRNKARFSLNVVYFKPSEFENDPDGKKQQAVDKEESNFAAMAKALNGEISTVVGLEAIESYVK